MVAAAVEGDPCRARVHSGENASESHFSPSSASPAVLSSRRRRRTNGPGQTVRPQTGRCPLITVPSPERSRRRRRRAKRGARECISRPRA